MPRDPFGAGELPSDHALRLHEGLLTQLLEGVSRREAVAALGKMSRDDWWIPDAHAATGSGESSTGIATSVVWAHVDDLVRAGFEPREAGDLVAVMVRRIALSHQDPTREGTEGRRARVVLEASDLSNLPREGWQRLVTLKGIGSGQSESFTVSSTVKCWRLTWVCGSHETQPHIAIFRVQGGPNRNASMSDPMIASVGDEGLTCGVAHVSQSGRFYLKSNIADWWIGHIDLQRDVAEF